jgi:hypothetical protein
VRHVAARPAQQFRELPADDIEHTVFGQYARFEGRPVRAFVPMLVERASRDTLAHQHRAAHRAQRTFDVMSVVNQSRITVRRWCCSCGIPYLVR